MTTPLGTRPEWAAVITEHAAEATTARKLIGQLVALEVASLAFCRLLERWARGEPDPSTPGRRQAALRRAADRVETALAGLEQPLGRYLLELEADMAEGRSWFGEASRGGLGGWGAGVKRGGGRGQPQPLAAPDPRVGGAPGAP